ncbi:MAG: hypothetical protein AAB345_03845 [Patescibacteria group bacterium]
MTKRWTLALIVVFGLCGFVGIILWDRAPIVAPALVALSLVCSPIISIGLCLTLFGPLEISCLECGRGVKTVCENCDVLNDKLAKRLAENPGLSDELKDRLENDEIA